MRSSSKSVAAASFAVISLLAAPSFAVGEPEASGTAKGRSAARCSAPNSCWSSKRRSMSNRPGPTLSVASLAGLAEAWAVYFIEKSASARVSMLMLAGGLTLAIPTTVAVLSATAYEPPADYLQDTAPPDEPVADPPQPTVRPSKRRPPVAAKTRARARQVRGERSVTVPSRNGTLAAATESAWLRLAPPALLDINPERIAIAIPGVEVRGRLHEDRDGGLRCEAGDRSASTGALCRLLICGHLKFASSACRDRARRNKSCRRSGANSLAIHGKFIEAVGSSA
jgi:hypothetical protein